MTATPSETHEAALSDERLRNFDTCACGDYRKDHKDGTGACIFNHTPGSVHGQNSCMHFRLSKAATDIPDFYKPRGAKS